MDEISSIRDLVGCWPSRAAMVADVNAVLAAPAVTIHQINKWAEKCSIPAKYHWPVIEAGTRRGYPLTAEMIVRLHAVAPGEGRAA